MGILMEIEKMTATELWEYAESLRDNGDYEQVARLYEKVANSDITYSIDKPYGPWEPQCLAAHALGKLYEDMLLPNSSTEQAIKWYEKAAHLGSWDATYKLVKYYLGCGNQDGYETAASYLWCAFYQTTVFEDNDMFALSLELLDKVVKHRKDILRILGDCYREGWGCEKSMTKYMEYSSKANELDIAEMEAEKQKGLIDF